MKTVVYQSYRTTAVPGWIARCMGTVRDWAALRGFDYLFVDDRLFDYVPAWYREKVQGQVQLVSDLARLELARELLAGEYERAIWVDADLVIFDADRFDIPTDKEYIFCREIWLERLTVRRALRDGLAHLSWPSRVQAWFRVNNALCVFTRANKMLDFYIHACQLMVKNRPGEIQALEVGTFFLTSLYERLRFPLLTNVGLFSPILLSDIARGKERYVKFYIKEFGAPVRAANLCASYEGKKYNGLTLHELDYDRALDQLVETSGAVVNRHLESGQMAFDPVATRRHNLSER